jgi:hypothetical protein
MQVKTLLITLVSYLFASDLWQVRGFFCAFRFTGTTNKADRHEITEILLKVVLNKMNRKFDLMFFKSVSLPYDHYSPSLTFTCHNLPLDALTDP